MQFSSAPAQLASVASNADMQTMLGRLTAARALALDNLDELVSLTEQRKLVAGGPGTILEPTGSLITPAAAAGAWTYGAWSQYNAAIATAEIIIGVALARQPTAVLSNAGELQIGVGAGGSEVVYATIPIPQLASTPAGSPVYIPMVLPVKVAIGARIAVRVRVDAGGTVQHVVQLHAVNPANVEKWST